MVGVRNLGMGDAEMTFRLSIYSLPTIDGCKDTALFGEMQSVPREKSRKYSVKCPVMTP